MINTDKPLVEMTDHELAMLQYNTTESEDKVISNIVRARKREICVDRMNRETDIDTKSMMESLIALGEFEFDLIFGPEKN